MSLRYDGLNLIITLFTNKCWLSDDCKNKRIESNGLRVDCNSMLVLKLSGKQMLIINYNMLIFILKGKVKI